MEDSGDSLDDTRSPCVRAFVKDFEQRDSSLGSGNETRPPVMTKSRVAQLRENLKKTSSSLDQDDTSSNGVKKPDDSDNSDTNTGSEYIVSVARLKESLQKSASEKHVAPWAFSSMAKESKKPSQTSNSDGEIIEDKIHSDHSKPKRKVNHSFKQAKYNLVEPFGKLEKREGNVSADVDINVAVNPGKCDSLPLECSRSDILLSLSSSGDEAEKHRAVPKVLPKPAVRKSKASSNKASLGASSDKQEGTRKKNSKTVDVDSNSSQEKYTSSVTNDTLSSETNHKCALPYQDISATCTVSEKDDASTCKSADEDVTLAHDDGNQDKTVPAKRNKNCTETVNAGETDDVQSVSKYDSEENDLSPSANEYVTDVHCLTADDSTPSSNEINEDQNHSPRTSSEPATHVITSDDESTTSCKQNLNYDTTAPAGDSLTELPAENSAAGANTVSDVPETDSRSSHSSHDESSKLSHKDLDLLDGTFSSVDTLFFQCMGSDFLIEVEELCSLTVEELEYDTLAEIVCSKVCGQEEDNARWLLSPPDGYRSAIDYVSNLFKNEIFMNVGVSKTSISVVDDSSFLSFDSLRETLLDKAMKKLERLTHLKQRLDVLVVKQDHFENELNAVMKKKIEAKYFSKYSSVIEDLDKVTHLLLMLSCRLANTDNSLDQISFAENEQQKAQLIAKRENLMTKYDEAVTLKDSIENRRHRLTDHLKQRLPPNEFSDYQHFVKTKCQLKLLKQSLEGRAVLSDEQIKVLFDLIERKTSARYC